MWGGRVRVMERMSVIEREIEGEMKGNRDAGHAECRNTKMLIHWTAMTAERARHIEREQDRERERLAS